MSANYTEFEVHITPAQARKLLKGKAIQLQPTQLQSVEPHTQTHKLHLAPENHKRLFKAKRSGKGARLSLSRDELERSGALWDTIKAGFNKYVKPVLSTVGDVVANSLSYSNPELAPVFQGVRQGVRDLTGVGVSKSGRVAKGSQAAKDRMTAVRAAKKIKSGSFRL